MHFLVVRARQFTQSLHVRARRARPGPCLYRTASGQPRWFAVGGVLDDPQVQETPFAGCAAAGYDGGDQAIPVGQLDLRIQTDGSALPAVE